MARYRTDGEPFEMLQPGGGKHRNGPFSSSMSGPPAEKTKYALMLQNACGQALGNVKLSEFIHNNNWAAPLATAPLAISTMAILLKAADMNAVAGLEVETQDVLDGGDIVGKLPSVFFHTNLQYCSDLGRLAFLDAQSYMGVIQATALRMIKPGSSITSILELLENPEDAQYDLRSEITVVQDATKTCLQKAQYISGQFRYWYLVIMHLKQTSLSKQGDVKKLKGETRDKSEKEKDNEHRSESLRRQLEQRIQELKQAIKECDVRMQNNQREISKLRLMEAELERRQRQEMEVLKSEVARIPPPQAQEIGLIFRAWEGFFGQMDSHFEEEQRRARKHEERTEGRLEKLRQEHKKRMDQAVQNLERENDAKGRLLESLGTTREDLTTTMREYTKATENLEKAKAEFRLLEDKDLELDGILHILENSQKQLADLQQKIEPMVEFFTTMVNEIEVNVQASVDDFLRPLSNRLGADTSLEIENLVLSQVAKGKMISAAVEIQGRFSVMTDISQTYITVSSKYIRPAINEMENLSTVHESEWAGQSQEFLDRCGSWMRSIQEVTRKASANVESNASRNMDELSRRLIEAAP